PPNDTTDPPWASSTWLPTDTRAQQNDAGPRSPIQRRISLHPLTITIHRNPKPPHFLPPAAAAASFSGEPYLQRPASAEPEQTLPFHHGCQVPGLLQHHYRVQPLPDSRGLPGLPDGALPAYRREGQANRGMLLPPQGRLRR
ncbi:hypothetical protein EJB05_38226, partial [Eragrostis curvula]